jgi:hypothetical protein
MSTGRMIELAAAVALLAFGLWLYRRPKADADRSDSYGSQGAVILFVISAIMGIHALGWLDYHPSQSELEIYKSRQQQ